MSKIWKALYAAKVRQDSAQPDSLDALADSVINAESPQAAHQIHAWKQEIIDALEPSLKVPYSCGRCVRIGEGLVDIYVPPVSMGGSGEKHPTRQDVFWIGAYPGRPTNYYVRSDHPQHLLQTRQELEIPSARLYPDLRGALVDCAKEILKELALDADVESFTIQAPPPVGGAKSAAQPLVGLSLKHGYGPNHELVFRPFIKSWLERFPHAPPMRFVEGEPKGAPTCIGDILAACLLRRPSGLEPKTNPNIVERVFERSGIPPSARATWSPLARAYFFVEQSPHKLQQRDPQATPQTVLEAHRELGLLSPFFCDAIAYLHKRFGTDALSKTDLRLHAKIVDDAYSLFMGLGFFGARTNMKVLVSNSSNSSTVHEMLRRWGVQTYTPARRSEFQASDHPPHHSLGAPQTVWLRPGTVETGALRGDHRFVLQNASDEDKYQAAKFPHVKVNDIVFKELESQLGGLKNTLIAAREIRHTWKKKPRDVPMTVVGAGYIGGNIVRALLAQGMDPKNIRVVDPDPNVRARFSACQTYADVQDVPQGAEQTYVFVATPPEVLTVNAMRGLGREQIVHNLVTGGRFLAETDRNRARRGLESQQLAKKAASRTWLGGMSANPAVKPVHYPDRVWPLGDGFIKFLCDLQAPNLVHLHWPQKAEVTSLALLVGVLLAASDEGKSDGPLVVPPELNRDLIEIAQKHRITDAVPLDASPDDPEEERLLREDLDSFRPK